MKPYAKFFGETIKNNGQPRLNDDQFRRLMNIVYFDGQLKGMQQIRNKIHERTGSDPFDMDLYRVSRQLTELTGNREPKDLLKEMIDQSEN
jgi:hypothetical protein